MAVTRLRRGRTAPRSGDDFVPFKRACERLGISVTKGYRLRKQDQFPVEVVRFGALYYCRRSELDKLARPA